MLIKSLVLTLSFQPMHVSWEVSAKSSPITVSALQLLFLTSQSDEPAMPVNLGILSTSEEQSDPVNLAIHVHVPFVQFPRKEH